MRDWHGGMYYNRKIRDEIDRFACKSSNTNMQQCSVTEPRTTVKIGHAIAAVIVVHGMKYS